MASASGALPGEIVFGSLPLRWHEAPRYNACMHIDIFTLFPGMVRGPLDESILARAQARGLVQVDIYDIRSATTDRHHVCDDLPYGGGAGMVMKPDPIFAAVEAVHQGGPIILLAAQGRVFTQAIARELSEHPRLSFICGHYEGIDERVRQHLATDEISIGDYVLMGGELAALVVTEAVTRLLPGVLGSAESTEEESHAAGLLEYPQYTRPPVFREWPVPEVLLSGNHAAIARWRKREALRRTRVERPDLFVAWLAMHSPLTKEDAKILRELDDQAARG
jgi:tRNA (guanine37-N1)-methyltransferase